MQQYAQAEAVHLEIGVSGDSPAMRWIGTLTGVTVLSVAARNGPGVGKLIASGVDDGGNPLVAWQAPGSSTPGIPQADALLSDGEDDSKWILIAPSDSDTTPLQGEAFVHITDNYNTLGPSDVAAADAAAGLVSVIHAKLFNHSGLPVQRVKLWIAAGETGSAALDVSTDGVTYVHPLSEADGAVLSWPIIASGASVDVYIRRTIGAATGFSPRVLNHLEFRWDGI